jgi:uncharacterized metal-binding protein YceD (DUF177 family)
VELKMTRAPAPEFSRPLDVAAVPPHGIKQKMDADEAERSALASRLGLAGLTGLHAELLIEPWREDGLKITGTLTASVIQTCVVTADDFDSRLADDFTRWFSSDDAVSDGSELFVDPLAEDEPDVIVDGTIDLGEVVAEQLALILDPYPRKPGAEFEASHDDGADAGKVTPFAALEKLRTSK